MGNEVNEVINNISGWLDSFAKGINGGVHIEADQVGDKRMIDLIKRQDAIRAVSLSCGTCLARNIEDCEKCSVPKLRELINVIPSAERPEGIWELVPCTDLSEYFEGVKNGFRYRCSNCKDERRRNKLENFCPHCGARMKGADDGSR